MPLRRFVSLPHAASTLLVLLATACGAADPRPSVAAAPAAASCLPDASGFLRARLRGALNADLDWHDAQIRCEGGARPDGAGLRVSIAGPLPDATGANAGRTLRFVFGIDTAAGATGGAALATNVTAIIEGAAAAQSAVFATRGDDKCTTDTLQRRAAGAAAGGGRDFRVDARGFCLGPASTLDGKERLLVTTFDFAGRVTLESP
jgi:hypothetical protein